MSQKSLTNSVIGYKYNVFIIEANIIMFLKNYRDLMLIFNQYCL